MGIRFFKLRNRFIKPYDEGWLPAVDGHEIHYYQVGNPKGEPVICFHGGPGGSVKLYYAAIYNLKKQRVILFDQRGCGLSRAENPLYCNTSQETVKDAKRLLDYLKVNEKVVAAGGSFGSTLAVLFAENYPELVKRLNVDCIFLGRPEDVEYMTPIAKYFYPDAVAEVEKQAGQEDLNAFYANMIFSDKKAENEKALRYYRRLERMAGGAEMTADFSPVEATPKDVQKFQIMMHYMINDMFLKENELLKNAPKIAHIPAEIVQNRMDFCCPPSQAWALHKALPKSELTMVPDSGHGSDKMRYVIYLKNKKRFK